MHNVLPFYVNTTHTQVLLFPQPTPSWLDGKHVGQESSEQWHTCMRGCASWAYTIPMQDLYVSSKCRARKKKILAVVNISFPGQGGDLIFLSPCLLLDLVVQNFLLGPGSAGTSASLCGLLHFVQEYVITGWQGHLAAMWVCPALLFG